MNQSEKFQQLQEILTESLSLKNLLNLIREIVIKYGDFTSESFIKSPHLKFLINEINKINMPELNQIMMDIKQPPCIIALPIKRQAKFTLFFVIVPNGQKFDWHSHPKMTGVSKCIHGNFSITTIDFHFLQKVQVNQYVYPKANMRVQNLSYQNSVSTIQPNAFNIHKIQANGLSAFFDLLLPDYPDNTCQFFKTAGENSDFLMLNEFAQSTEQIRGWDIYIKQLKKTEKYIIKNVILQ